MESYTINFSVPVIGTSKAPPAFVGLNELVAKMGTDWLTKAFASNPLVITSQQRVVQKPTLMPEGTTAGTHRIRINRGWVTITDHRESRGRPVDPNSMLLQTTDRSTQEVFTFCECQMLVKK